MPINIKIDNYNLISIDTFTTQKGREYISLRHLNQGKDGKAYPVKTKSGGYNSIYASAESWDEILPRLIQFVYAKLGREPSEIGMETEHPQEVHCTGCGQLIEGGRILCHGCFVKEAEGLNEEGGDDF